MSSTKKNIKRIISDLEDGIYDIEKAKDNLEEMKEELASILDEQQSNINQGPNLSSILQWFESPFVADYDKRIVLEKFKHLL